MAKAGHDYDMLDWRHTTLGRMSRCNSNGETALDHHVLQAAYFISV